MLINLRKKIASDSIDDLVNQRVASILNKMDPFEPLLRKYSGVFSEEFEHPEESFAESEKMQMYMAAWKIKEDKYINFLIDWIMNTAGNSVLKRNDPTPERILYARSQIANMVLLKREIGRLSSNYEQILKKDEKFDPHVGID